MSPTPSPFLFFPEDVAVSTQLSRAGRWFYPGPPTLLQRNANELILHCEVRVARDGIMGVVNINKPYTSESYGGHVLKMTLSKEYTTAAIHLLFL